VPGVRCAFDHAPWLASLFTFSTAGATTTTPTRGGPGVRRSPRRPGGQAGGRFRALSHTPSRASPIPFWIRRFRVCAAVFGKSHSSWLVVRRKGTSRRKTHGIDSDFQRRNRETAVHRDRGSRSPTNNFVRTADRTLVDFGCQHPPISGGQNAQSPLKIRLFLANSARSQSRMQKSTGAIGVPHRRSAIVETVRTRRREVQEVMHAVRLPCFARRHSRIPSSGERGDPGEAAALS